ncbi:ankyrin repeat protein [Ophiocordyceps camponoti-floridani]|uniref:Ankyrin repeat protein n=1 Tax=Ophiocordyceps camponoti-floridani TaxID=2030778 RepID=A0A8H4Q7G0_9HYPO|nr:ankyrin repeat protein [Ophiocordyceps camponoti-floridani]
MSVPINDPNWSRLVLVHEPPENASPSLTVEAILVHGLHGDLYRTWSRVFAYDGAISLDGHGSFVIGSNLQKAAWALLMEMVNKVDLTKPLIFICHNIGGILVKELLWIANHRGTAFRDIAVATKSLIFLGTPPMECFWEQTINSIIMTSWSGDAEQTQLTRESEQRIVHMFGLLFLEATTARWRMIEKQYRTRCVYEDKPTANLGIVVAGGEDDFTQLDADHNELGFKWLRFAEAFGRIVYLENRSPIREIPDQLKSAINCRSSLFESFPHDQRLGRILSDAVSTPMDLEWNLALEQARGIFTVIGSSGSGKTALAKQIAKNRGQNMQVGRVLSFYFSKADYRRRSYRDVLYSFVLQLLYDKLDDFQSAHMQRILTGVSSMSKSTVPNLFGLLRAMMAAASGQRTFVIIIDSIHECEEESRKQLMDDLKVIYETADDGNVLIMVTCKLTEDIEESLGPFDINNSFRLDDFMDDAREMTLSQFEDSAAMREFRAVLRERNATPLTALLAGALTAQNPENVPNPRTINSYDEFYRAIFSRISGEKTWIRDILCLVASSDRPLTVPELAVALIVDRCSFEGGRITLSCVLAAVTEGLVVQVTRTLRESLRYLVFIKDNAVHLVSDTFRMHIRHQPQLGLRMPHFGGALATDRSLRCLLLRKCLTVLSIPELRQPGLLPVETDFHAAVYQIAGPVRSFATYAGYSLKRLMNDAVADFTGRGATQIRDGIMEFWNDSEARKWWIETFHKGIDPSQPSLVLAAILGVRPVLQSLLETVHDKSLVRALALAAVKHDQLETLRMLLDVLRDDDSSADDEDPNDFALEMEFSFMTIKEACKSSSVGLAEHLFVDCPRIPIDDIMKNLLVLAGNGNWHVAPRLLHEGVCFVRTLGREVVVSLIEKAASLGREGFIRSLLGKCKLDRDFDALLKVNGQLNNAFLTAAAFGSTYVFELLIPYVFPGVAISEAAVGDAAFHVAAMNGNTEIVRRMFDYGMNVNVLDENYKTALHKAIEKQSCNEDMIDLLISKECNIDQQDDQGHSALYYAIRNNFEFTRNLWDPRHDISKRGISILFDAASQGNVGRVNQLLAAGYDRDEKDKWGRTAADVAVQADVRALLLESEVPRGRACPMIQSEDVVNRIWACYNCQQVLDNMAFYLAIQSTYKL